jgi:molybdopterin molybdotransferase
MIRTLAVGLEEALELTLKRIRPLNTEIVALSDSVDRVAAEDLHARVDSPSVDASLKDGFAVLSEEVAAATPEHPVRLKRIGCVSAGGRNDLRVEPGTTVQVLKGAKIPEGADAVVSEEFTEAAGDDILFKILAEPGRNILPRGSDVASGKRIIFKGGRLTPGRVGMLAASGHHRVPVVRNPSVAVIATGDEVVAPGQPLPEGKLYASNIATLDSWCRRYGMRTSRFHVKDDPEEILNTLTAAAENSDAVLTSGGAWTGDRDMVAKILAELGWEQVFHRIRIGPGKAVGFGLLKEKPVFILPGGPPSNLMGFLQIALPGLLTLGGHIRPGLPRASVRLASELTGRYDDWTQFIFGVLDHGGDLPVFHSLEGASRLRSMAEAQAVVAIPEGKTVLAAGSVVSVQLLE